MTPRQVILGRRGAFLDPSQIQDSADVLLPVLQLGERRPPATLSSHLESERSIIVRSKAFQNPPRGVVLRHERLGGIVNHYYRTAA